MQVRIENINEERLSAEMNGILRSIARLARDPVVDIRIAVSRFLSVLYGKGLPFSLCSDTVELTYFCSNIWPSCGIFSRLPEQRRGSIFRSITRRQVIPRPGTTT